LSLDMQMLNSLDCGRCYVQFNRISCHPIHICLESHRWLPCWARTASALLMTGSKNECQGPLTPCRESGKKSRKWLLWGWQRLTTLTFMPSAARRVVLVLMRTYMGTGRTAGEFHFLMFHLVNKAPKCKACPALQLQANASG